MTLAFAEDNGPLSGLVDLEIVAFDDQAVGAICGQFKMRAWGNHVKV